MFITLLAAFQTLLHRYSGQTDLAIGSPVANRNREETEGLIGFFLNTLVLRGDLSGNPTFRELLSRAREVALAAYGHQDVPFEKLVEELQPERSLGHSPLFQVMFVVQQPDVPIDLLGLAPSYEGLALGGTTAKFDLTLFVEDGADAMRCMIEYATDLFDAATIARMGDHFQRLVAGIVANPDQKISALPLLSERERAQQLVEWNDTARAYGADACLHELFEQQVDRTPDAVALVAGARTLTYRELDARANQLAHHLRACGVTPGALVGIFLERSEQLVIALLAALKSGAAYVPLDPTYPKDRLAFIHADAHPHVLVTEAALDGRLPELGVHVVRVDGDREIAAIAGAPATRLPASASRHHLSHVIYTSGSTGRPKGVAIEHAVMVNYARFSGELHPKGELRACLFATSVCFDMSLFELFVPLALGGRVIVVDDVFSLPSVAATAGITYLNAVPSVLAAYLRTGALPSTLEAISCAGEPLSNGLVQQLHAAGVPRVYDFYGPTETFIATWSLRSGEGTAVIGRPIANAQIYLLDAHGELVPRGARGELHVGGDGLAREYLHRPELTAERFIANPFGPGRLYKTGDVARWLPDGTLAYVGRIDHQVKIRGFRVEPGEIEVLLGNHPAVRAVAVIAREDVPGDRRLVAYVVGSDASAPLAVSELRAYVKAHLPDYMVPSAFVLLDALPQTPNGKIDRKALPAPEAGRAALARAYTAPRTPTQARIAAIWSELLGVGEVGIDDNFFELGGHSLLATQVVSRIREAFRIELPLRSMFEGSTVAALADKVAAAARTSSAHAITRVPRDGELALSFAQQRLWFLEQLEPGSALYHLGEAVRLRGALDLDALTRSIATIVQRHEALRTTFVAREGRAVQVIAPSLEVPLELVAMASESELHRYLDDDARRTFDLSRGPLLRVRVARLAPDDHVLVIAMHHIVFDGWSFGVFWRELATCYRAYAAAREPELPRLAIQYADFAAWQRAWLSGGALSAQLAYWKQRLAGMPSLLELPTDRPRPAVQRFRGDVRMFELSAELTAALHELARQHSATLFMTLLAAFQALLCRYTRQSDFAIGTPVANRNRADIEPLIGFFVNTLVLRADLSGDPSFADVVARVRETALGAYAHQDIPFEKLVEELEPVRSLAYTPLFQVAFTLDDDHGVAHELPGLDTRAFDAEPDSTADSEPGTAKFDLSLYLTPRAGGLHGMFEYDVDLFDASTIDRMSGHFERLLAGIVANPQQRISELPLLSEPERHQLVVAWNDTARAYPHDGWIHERFAAQAAATPTRTALVFEDESLTYAELDARANQLARYLQGLGVGPETLVGVMLERSLEMVISLFAILKAGGAYVPFDPSYPPDRLAYMIEDARARIVITPDWLAASAHEISRQPTDALEVALAPNHLAYVIYTSGSTGRPKGAMNTHAGIANRLRWMQAQYQLGADDRVLQKTPFSFDVSVWEFFWPLMVGARLVIAKPGGHQDPSYLVDTIAREGITTLHFVPPMLAVFLETADVARCTSLRCVVSSGEALAYELVVRFHERLHAKLHNLYGPTEAAVDVSHWTCEPDGPPVVPIGYPIANLRLHVLDTHYAPVPRGAAGEIHLAGIGLGRGYLDRPALTAERFVPDPFSPEPGGRLYRTGDLGRVRADGAIEYLGRIDHQVKIRGFRIELGEIEAQIAAHPSVRECVVLVREDSPGDKRLVAYLVGGDVAAVRARLATKLPDYMVPSAFVVLDALPLTPNGKIDRKALPAPEHVSVVDRVAPRTRAELELARMFAELLDVPVVGARDDFFELGGHSLLAIQLFAAIRLRLGVTLPVTTLFRAPTVETLAREIDKASTAAVSNLVVLREHGDGAPIICVHPVGGTVFAYQPLVARLAPGAPVYAFEARGIAPGEAPAETIEEMANAYVQTLLATRAARPVHLVGWSFGGLVALEIARVWTAAGHEVLSTTLIDTFAPAPEPDALETGDPIRRARAVRARSRTRPRGPRPSHAHAGRRARAHRRRRGRRGVDARAPGPRSSRAARAAVRRQPARDRALRAGRPRRPRHADPRGGYERRRWRRSGRGLARAARRSPRRDRRAGHALHDGRAAERRPARAHDRRRGHSGPSIASALTAAARLRVNGPARLLTRRWRPARPAVLAPSMPMPNAALIWTF